MPPLDRNRIFVNDEQKYRPICSPEPLCWGSHFRESSALRELREETALLPDSSMQILPDQAAFLVMLVQITNSRRIIEIGTFTGYSALTMAQVLPPDGKLIACDISKPWTDVAQRHWQKAGVASLIELHLAPACETLDKLLQTGHEDTFDFAFIDANKVAYDQYYEACLRLVKVGGLIVLDNMLWEGAVADDSVQDADTVALRTLNAKLRDDGRVDISLLAVADGIMLARKR